MRGLEPVEKSEGARASPPSDACDYGLIAGEGRAEEKWNGSVPTLANLRSDHCSKPRTERGCSNKMDICRPLWGGALGTSVKTKSLTSVRR